MPRLLKMTPDHYAILKPLIINAIQFTAPPKELDNQGLPSLRHQQKLFDTILTEGTDQNFPDGFAGDLYAYLNDAHIDSAVRRILLDHRKEENKKCSL